MSSYKKISNFSEKTAIIKIGIFFMSKFEQKTSLSIGMDPSTAEYLKSSVTDWLEPFICENGHDECLREGDKCIPAEDISFELNRILKDNKLDRVEAPLFYATIAELADDGYLTMNEALNVTLWLTASPASRILGNLQNMDMSDSDNNEREDFMGLSPFVGSVQSYMLMFKSDDAKMLAVIQQTLMVAEQIQYDIEFAEDVYQTLTDNERSYLNFISAENLWGISYLIADQTFSSLEVDGVRRYLERLRSIGTGSLIFLAGLLKGYLIDNDPFVQEFLHSSYGKVSMIGPLYQQSKSTVFEELGDSYYKQYCVDSVWLAVECGAYRFAEVLVDRYENNTKVKIKGRDFEHVLPSGLFRFFNGPVTRLGNALGSLDSAVSYISGGVVGRLAARGLRGQKVVAASLRTLGPVRKLLPGIEWVAVNAGDSLMGWRGIKWLVNFSAEWSKLSVYSYGGSVLGGDDGAQAGAMIYLFGLGSSVMFRSAMEGVLSRDIIKADIEAISSGNISDAAMQIIRRSEEMSAVELENLAKRIARSATRGADLTLPKGMNSAQLANRLTKLRGEIAKIERIETNMFDALDRITSLQSEILTTAAKNGEAVRIQAIEDMYAQLEKIDKLHIGGDITFQQLQTAAAKIRDVKNRLDAILGDIKGQLKVEKKPAPSAAPTTRKAGAKASERRVSTERPALEHPDRIPVEKSGAGPGKQKINRTVVTVADPAQAILTNPPLELSPVLLSAVSRGRVSFANGCTELKGWYHRTTPANRKALLRRIHELSLGELRGWKVSTRNSVISHARVARSFRLFVERDGNGFYKITNLKHRGNIHGWREGY
ncbi:MAG: hypothetical protein COV46_03160 [Deltaproteobacteria bacterium CG11_big_fil_rev_8_21_14_0_20_49_13]|nr:MAG: hypothetical protein COV46_03160 [Deltaproteobacteria bacterium CG11_big_fil_rev_8_21_14_0_20_49_13]